MSDEPIPLWEGELSGAAIVPERGAGAAVQTVRSGRKAPRTQCDGAYVCFSPDLPSGVQEHVECPVIDKSAQGFAVEYDRRLEAGVRAHLAFITVGHQPVRVSCSVRRCAPLENGHYVIGLKLDRPLNFEEKRLAKSTAGKLISLGIRPRKLREAKPAGAEVETAPA